MTMTRGRIERTGSIRFGDASMGICEVGAPRGSTWDESKAWERQFKRDVFARIVQTLNRLGWTVEPNTYIFTDNNNRYCRKGNLRADLKLSGRCIEFNMFQNVNAPNRPDHGGRYEFGKELLMPYVMRLEMERTRARIRNYLCNVFTGYEFQPPRISSPNPDPLAYFNATWDSEYEKHHGIHRFKRGEDGWPSELEIGSWDRKDHDGSLLNHGDVRWLRTRNGRLLRGRVYGGINGMWMFVFGPGHRDHKHESAGKFFTYRHGETPRKLVAENVRRNRLESELKKAIETMNFERAATLRDLIFPDANPVELEIGHA